MTDYVAYDEVTGTCAIFERVLVATVTTTMWSTIQKIVHLALAKSTGISTTSVIETVLGYEMVPACYAPEFINAARPSSYTAPSQHTPPALSGMTVRNSSDPGYCELVKERFVAAISANLWKVVCNVVAIHDTLHTSTDSNLESLITSILTYELAQPNGRAPAVITAARAKNSEATDGCKDT